MRYCFSLLITLLCLNLPAQELTRRSFLGIRMENVSEDVMRVMELKDTSGVLIAAVNRGSTAEAAGFRNGDILLKIDNTAINSPQEAVAYVGARKSNTGFTYELIRDKKRLTGRAVFKPYPLESYPDLAVTYTQVKTALGLQRVIISKKRESNGPAVVFIGGIGCYSLDSPLDTNRSELQLLNALARAGYTTVRIEKPGIGDGAGHSKACNEIGFNAEVTGYIAAIDELRAREVIGKKPAYLIGHSMGGLMAPMIAAKTKVDGIIAYGTIGSNFMEYLVKTRRTIGEAYNWPPEETDDFVKDYCQCASYYFYEKMSTEDAAKKNPDCREYLSVFDLRSREYNNELFALNIPALWKQYDGDALIAWGESDYIASREDHEIIAATMERYHKGKATLAIIKATDHGMNYAASFAEARTNPGGYNTEVTALFLDWLKKRSS